MHLRKLFFLRVRRCCISVHSFGNLRSLRVRRCNISVHVRPLLYTQFLSLTIEVYSHEHSMKRGLLRPVTIGATHLAHRRCARCVFVFFWLTIGAHIAKMRRRSKTSDAIVNCVEVENRTSLQYSRFLYCCTAQVTKKMLRTNTAL
jgi:hypothetical protein